MITAIAFLVAALIAAWLPDRLSVRKPVTVLAGGLGLLGMHENGWLGWGWDWGAWWILLSLTLVIAGYWRAKYGHDFTPKAPAADDMAWGILWGALQQGVLLGFLYQVHPALAIVAFPLLHLPNGFLTALTAVAGPVSVFTAEFVGLSIPAAAVCHALLSLAASTGLPRSVTNGMCVGHDCLAARMRI